MHILVTGKNGQLGSELQRVAKNYPLFSFYFTGSDELDITSKDEVNNLFSNNSFDVVINCAAYTAVDKAEDESEKAYAVNRDGVQHLVNACQTTNTALIHVSTDYVFDGRGHRPYVESDNVHPIGVYGKSKRAGEEGILHSSVTALIIRTSWVYSAFGNNFVKTMLRLSKERDELSVIFDQIGSPTNAQDLAMAIMQCVEQNERWNNKQEIYHYSNEGVCSWYDFAHTIFELNNMDIKLNPILTKDYPTKAARPHYSVLDKTKIKTDFNLNIPHWKESLEYTTLSSKP
jgi:dTDP-4-dehydrorhamnose reductase